MFIQELACLEVLLNHLINNSDLNREIFTDFSSTKTFDTKKNNLFNIISINNLLSNYREPAPFALPKFCRNGIIKGVYTTPTPTPIMDPKDQYDPVSFIANIVEAFKEDNYIFDEDRNVYVSSEKVEVDLPQAWLYRLSEGFKRKQFSKLFFYNKNEETDISDRMSLIDYLRHTKTFLVSITSSTRDDYDIAFAKAEALTNNEVKNYPIVRVEELIKIFQSKIPRDYKVGIDRYKLTDLLFIVKKADEMGQEFYTKTLEEQKEIINNWIIDFINSNKKSSESAQEYLLLGDKNPELNKREVIAGLINLYFNLLKNQELDFNDISLTDFKIDTYIPLKLQQSLEDKKTLVQALNRMKKDKFLLKSKIDKFGKRIEEISVNDPDLKNLKSAYSSLEEKYHLLEQEETRYQKTYNYLQETTREKQRESILDISFANNEIMSLIIEATQNGRVYIRKDDQITFELYNNQLGKTSFKATISTRDFLTLIENINYSLKEAFKSTKS